VSTIVTTPRNLTIGKECGWPHTFLTAATLSRWGAGLWTFVQAKLRRTQTIPANPAILGSVTDISITHIGNWKIS
jgi:hypothetical protein